MPFLILATLKGNVRVMKFLLEKEVESINVRDAHHGNTPLHYAVRTATAHPPPSSLALPPLIHRTMYPTHR